MGNNKENRKIDHTAKKKMNQGMHQKIPCVRFMCVEPLSVWHTYLIGTSCFVSFREYSPILFRAQIKTIELLQGSVHAASTPTFRHFSRFQRFSRAQNCVRENRMCGSCSSVKQSSKLVFQAEKERNRQTCEIFSIIQNLNDWILVQTTSHSSPFMSFLALHINSPNDQ